MAMEDAKAAPAAASSCSAASSGASVSTTAADAYPICSGAAEELERDGADGVPAELICPITAELMTDPVVTADGHTYDREAIESWLRRKTTSPLTGEPLEHLMLTPNHIVRGMCRRYGSEGNSRG